MGEVRMGERTAEDRPVHEVDGRRVGIEVRGAGEPLVLLHGIGRDRQDWAAVVPALAAHFTVYALDLEGFGESEPWGERLSLASIAAMVRRTLVVLGERRPVRLVGNSMGGAVALRMTADDPASVAALVLVASAGFGRDAAFTLRLMTVPVLGPMLLRLDRVAATVQVRSLFADRRFVTRELIAASAERMRRPGARRRYLDVIRDLGAWSGVRTEWRQEVLTALAAAGIPTLVLWGERDVVLPSRHLEEAAARLPEAILRTLPGLGHAPQMEDPEGFVTAVLEFLRAAPADASLPEPQGPCADSVERR